MPSPFPGMDPYLEGSEWPSFHTQLIAEFGRQLTPKLVPKYLARVGEREVLTISGMEDDERVEMYPDVAIIAQPGATKSPEWSSGGGSIVAAPLQVRTVIGKPATERFLEIRDAKHRDLVTQIELLSPTNKRSDGYLEYLGKRNHVLRSKVHLLEIDLLVNGRRVPMKDPLPLVPYFVFLSRADERPYTGTWPIRLSDPLPAVPVPLLGDDEDVLLDLQAALTSVYEQLGYEFELDYTESPRVALPEALASWVRDFLAKSKPLPP